MSHSDNPLHPWLCYYSQQQLEVYRHLKKKVSLSYKTWIVIVFLLTDLTAASMIKSLSSKQIWREGVKTNLSVSPGWDRCSLLTFEMRSSSINTSIDVWPHKYQHLVNSCFSPPVQRSLCIKTSVRPRCLLLLIRRPPLSSTLSPYSCHWGPPGSGAPGPLRHCWWRGPPSGRGPS